MVWREIDVSRGGRVSRDGGEVGGVLRGLEVGTSWMTAQCDVNVRFAQREVGG